MKKVSLMLFVALLSLPFGRIMAQGALKNIAGYNFTNVNGPDESSCKDFEYPSQIIVYDGKKIEARGIVTYKYNAVTREYERLYLRVFMKSLCNDYLLPEDIATTEKLADVYSLVQHERFGKKGSRQRIRGKADVYARAFGEVPCPADNMLELRYNAVFDCDNPEKSEITFKLSDGRWKTPRNYAKDIYARSEMKYGGWNFQLHGAGRFGFADGSFLPAEQSALIGALWWQYPPEAESGRATGARSLPRPLYVFTNVYVKGIDKNGQFGHYTIGGDVQSGRQWDLTRMFVLKENSKEITLQNTYNINRLPNGYLPLRYFAKSDKMVHMDCRSYLKFKSKNPKKHQGFDNVILERATFSCYIHK